MIVDKLDDHIAYRDPDLRMEPILGDRRHHHRQQRREDAAKKGQHIQDGAQDSQQNSIRHPQDEQGYRIERGYDESFDEQPIHITLDRTPHL